MTYFFNANGELEKEYRGAVLDNKDYQEYVKIMKSMISKD
jgi:hypothetical protein